MTPENLSDDVVAGVLRAIAKRQEEHHRENTGPIHRTLEIVEEVRDDVSEIKTDVALIGRDVSDLKEWRKLHVDPFINTATALSNQAQGAIKITRYFWPTFSTACLVVVAWGVRTAAEIIPVLHK